MPIQRGKDAKGPFYQFGAGRKNYYEVGNPESRAGAKAAAERSARAVKASQTRRRRGA